MRNLLITFVFFASAALTCLGVLLVGYLLEEELLALLFASSLGSSNPPPRPTEPGPFFLVSGVCTEIKNKQVVPRMVLLLNISFQYEIKIYL